MRSIHRCGQTGAPSRTQAQMPASQTPGPRDPEKAAHEVSSQTFVIQLVFVIERRGGAVPGSHRVLPGHRHFLHSSEGRRVGGHWLLLRSLPGHLATARVQIVSPGSSSQRPEPTVKGQAGRGRRAVKTSLLKGRATSLNLSPSFPQSPATQT